MREGVTAARFAARHGVDLHTVFAAELDRLAAQGLLEVDAGRVRVTPRGLLLCNQVAAAFLES